MHLDKGEKKAEGVACTMALRGEGDPRWVVRERNDGRNVNGWHWEDKNVTTWAQKRLKALLEADICRCECAGVTVAVASVEKVDGDATLYNRKGVLKVLYDLKVTGKWTSMEEDVGERTYGEFKFELFDAEPEIGVSMDGKSRCVRRFKEGFEREVAGVIVRQCGVFIEELNGGADQAVDGLDVGGGKKVGELNVMDFKRSGMKGVTETNGGGDVGNGGELVLKEEFLCRGTDMYLALTDAPRLEAITRGRVVSEAKVGGRLDILGGRVLGKYRKLIIGELVEMEWKLKSWGEGTEMGFVSVGIAEEEGKTEVTVRVRGVPKEERSATEGFWRVQMFQGMKVVMGWGSASHFL